MPTALEDLRILNQAGKVADEIWKRVSGWDSFARDVVGKQLARAVDSIGANIAESFGRFNYGEKLQFLYYARGSLFETKYWLNRSQSRTLLTDSVVFNYSKELTELARQLNAFAKSIKEQRHPQPPSADALRETGSEYQIDEYPPVPLFSQDDLEWLLSISEKITSPTGQSPISIL